MALPKILKNVSDKLGDVPALIEQLTGLVNQVTTLVEQQDRIEAKLDQLIAQTAPAKEAKK